MAQTIRGDASFPMDGEARPHRFEVVSTAENTLSIWIEDRKSKRQWKSKELALTAFVTTGHAIPKATALAYAQMATHICSVEFSFTLHEVPIDGVAVLSTRLQDVEEASTSSTARVCELETEVKSLKHKVHGSRVA